MRWGVADGVEILQDEAFTIVGPFASGDARLMEMRKGKQPMNVFGCNSQKCTIAEWH